MMFLKFKHKSIIYFVLFFSCFVFAQNTPVEIAPEFNFSNQELLDSWLDETDEFEAKSKANLKFQNLFREAVSKSCGECKIINLVDKYNNPKFRVTYLDGFYFDITLDPAVIEITAKAVSIETWNSKKMELNRDIFGVAKSLGLRPEGAGHLNFAAKPLFFDDPLLFRNIIVDYYNHWALGTTLFSDGNARSNQINAPHIQALDSARIEAFQKLLSDFDADPKSMTLFTFVERLQKEVYISTGDPLFPYKYISANVDSLNPDHAWPHLEIRPIRPQQSLEEFIDISQIFIKRMKKLASVKYPIPYTASLVKSSQLWTANALQSAKQLHNYAKDSGLSSRKIAILINDKIIASEFLKLPKLGKDPNCNDLIRELMP